MTMEHSETVFLDSREFDSDVDVGPELVSLALLLGEIRARQKADSPLPGHWSHDGDPEFRLGACWPAGIVKNARELGNCLEAAIQGGYRPTDDIARLGDLAFQKLAEDQRAVVTAVNAGTCDVLSTRNVAGIVIARQARKLPIDYSFPWVKCGVRYFRGPPKFSTQLTGLRFTLRGGETDASRG